MSTTNGSPDEMDQALRFLRMRDPLQLDDGTVDRLLDGMPVDDAPPSYRGVVELLSTLKAAPTAAELSGERQAVTTITARTRDAARQSPPSRKSSVKRRLQLTGAALVGTATLFVGLGAAGALPGAAQSVASDMLSRVGVSTPGPDAHAGTHPDTRGESGDHVDATSTDSVDASGPAATSGKGATVSGIATDPSTTGVDNGAAVSSAASDGQSQAGEHGDASAPDVTLPTAANPPVTVPNPGGTTTGDTASGGTSDTGTNIADGASGGHADAGSGNASNGLANKP